MWFYDFLISLPFLPLTTLSSGQACNPSLKEPIHYGPGLAFNGKKEKTHQYGNSFTKYAKFSKKH